MQGSNDHLTVCLLEAFQCNKFGSTISFLFLIFYVSDNWYEYFLNYFIYAFSLYNN